ncbi:hypothetical protein [Halorussus halobius]|uniref:hypothetical protein n=1 Tax=Halorussus halobius TaxID=1710537 RepID=UPI001091F942|nr:hypothetical protein [Halorussus halobius]
MRTLAEPVEGAEVRVEPKETPGIEVNGVPATVDYVAKADVRVDLADETCSDLLDGTRSFVVEHVLGPLGLRGVTAAKVVGVREEWDFARPEHRFCYAAEMGPDSVVGHPAGLPNPALAEALGEVDLVESEPRPRRTVSEPVTFAAGGGEIELRPREYGAGVRFDVRLGDATITAEVDPQGDNDEALIESVTNSTTPYLSPTDEEAVTHSIADLVSDLAVVGGFDDLAVEADLGDAYHALTVGAARTAHRSGLVERRE